MFLMAVTLLFVHVAPSLFHDPLGFPFQFPGFLVATFLGHFSDFTGSFMHPVLESLFAVVFPLAMFAMMVTLSTVICPVPFPVVFAVAVAARVVISFPMVIAVAFPLSRFLGPNPSYLAAHFLGLLVFALLLQGFDLAAFLVDPFTQLVIVLFDSLVVASFTVFRDEVTCGYGGKQDADECV